MSSQWNTTYFESSNVVVIRKYFCSRPYQTSGHVSPLKAVSYILTPMAYILTSNPPRESLANKIAHHDRDQMAAILQTAFSNHFLEWKCLYIDSDVSENCCPINNNPASDIWTNDCKYHWRIYPPLGFDELTNSQIVNRQCINILKLSTGCVQVIYRWSSLELGTVARGVTII